MKILRNNFLQICELPLHSEISLVIISSCGVTHTLQKKIYPNHRCSFECQLVYLLSQTCFQKKNGPFKFLFCLDEKEGGWKGSSPALKKALPKKGRTEEHHTNIESPLDHRKSPAFSDKYLLQPPPAYTCQDSGVESSLWTPTPMLCTSAALPTFCLLYLTILFFLVLLQKQLQDVMSSYYKGNMWVGMSGLWKSTATAK